MSAMRASLLLLFLSTDVSPGHFASSTFIRSLNYPREQYRSSKAGTMKISERLDRRLRSGVS